MTEQEIKDALAKLVRTMLDKGLRLPGAQYSIMANHPDPEWFVHCGRTDDGDGQAKFFKSTDDAEIWIAGLKSGDELKAEAFTKTLAKLIEQGRDIGLEVNPLTDMMKSLSHNILEIRHAAT